MILFVIHLVAFRTALTKSSLYNAGTEKATNTRKKDNDGVTYIHLKL